jgi:hypothetical protein
VPRVSASQSKDWGVCDERLIVKSLGCGNILRKQNLARLGGGIDTLQTLSVPLFWRGLNHYMVESVMLNVA